jgi:hypothetical protein
VDFFIQMHVGNEAVKSSRIEGTRTDLGEAILQEEDIAPEKKADWIEVQNYIEAMNTGIARLNKLPISMRLLQEAHKILMAGARGGDKRPGEIRTAQNRFPLENAETSAIGRMLHNAGLSKFSEGIPRPSFDEMRRVQLQVVPTAEVGLTVTTEHDPWTSFGEAVDSVANGLVTGTAILDVPECQHGPMAFKEGTGKTGAPYKGFVCTNKNREFQCPPRWQK